MTKSQLKSQTHEESKGLLALPACVIPCDLTLALVPGGGGGHACRTAHAKPWNAVFF